MIKVALVRGKYLNNFEGQNFIFPKSQISLTAISSFNPLHKNFPFPVIKLPSLADLGLTKSLEWLVKVITNRTLGDSQILLGLKKYAGEFDIFHTADAHYYYTYQLACLREKNLIKRLIITSWETIPFNHEKTFRKRWLKKFSQKFADIFLCYTQKAAKALVTEGVDKQKIKVIRLGVDLDRFKPQKVKLKSFNILFVGRLIEEKGIIDLYQAYRKIKRQKLKVKNYNIRLRIVGEGSLQNHLWQMIKRDGETLSTTIEKRIYEEMPSVYQEGDIFVLPSKTTKTWEEQYGMVLVEAMASGLPIVAYNSGAIAEVLDGVGLLVKEGDVDGLASWLIRLIEDKNLREKLSQMARARAKKEFDSKKTSKKIAKIYQDLIFY